MVDRHRRVVQVDQVPPRRLRLLADPFDAAAPRELGFLPTERVLQRPAVPPDMVVRGDLVDVLREHADVPVVLLTGSPGFGKTTLIAQWDDEDPRPFTWVTVDATCNDARILVTYVALALQRVAEADPGVLTALAEQSDVTGTLLPRLGRMLTSITTPFVLVVDDVGLLTAQDALDVITLIADHLPP